MDNRVDVAKLSREFNIVMVIRCIFKTNDITLYPCFTL